MNPAQSEQPVTVGPKYAPPPAVRGPPGPPKEPFRAITGAQEGRRGPSTCYRCVSFDMAAKLTFSDWPFWAKGPFWGHQTKSISMRKSFGVGKMG